MEAMYLLAIAKSPRASADRELVRWQSGQDDYYSKVSATVQRDSAPLKLQIDFKSSFSTVRENGNSLDHEESGARNEVVSVQKYIRVNGAPRRASDLVGQLNAVMFTADDLELVFGPPAIRRRYLDILISQLDQSYLRSLQRYQGIVYRRNRLLRMIRDGISRTDELQFWNDELVNEGKHIISKRLETVHRLSELADPVHRELSDDGEELSLEYAPSGGLEVAAFESTDMLAEGLRRALDERRQRELAQGITVTGPHRDDLQVRINGMDAGAYASRGQARTAVLTMRLSESRYLAEQRRQEPILLLDDVLSELDPDRRRQVLDNALGYQQCFVTTTDANSIEDRFLSRMSRLTVSQGQVARSNQS